MRHQSFIGVPGVALAGAVARVIGLGMQGPPAGWAGNLMGVGDYLKGGVGVALARAPAPGPRGGTGPRAGGGGGGPDNGARAYFRGLLVW